MFWFGLLIVSCLVFLAGFILFVWSIFQKGVNDAGREIYRDYDRKNVIEHDKRTGYVSKLELERRKMNQERLRYEEDERNKINKGILTMVAEFKAKYPQADKSLFNRFENEIAGSTNLKDFQRYENEIRDSHNSKKKQ